MIMTRYPVVWIVSEYHGGCPTAQSLFLTERDAKRYWDDFFCEEDIAEFEYVCVEGLPLTADSAWKHGYCEMHKDEFRWEREVIRTIDYFEKSDYDSRELVYQALLEELCGRLIESLQPHAECRKEFDDWIGFSDGPNDLKEWQAKDILWGDSGIESWGEWYRHENRPAGTIHFADYAHACIELIQKRGIKDMSEYDQQNLLHYCSMWNMDCDVKDYDEEDYDLAKRSALMLYDLGYATIKQLDAWGVFIGTDPEHGAFEPVEDTGEVATDMITIRMPSAAWDVLAETLAMDIESSNISKDLRKEIEEALGQVVFE